MTKFKLNRKAVQRQLLEHGYTIAEAQRKAGLATYTLYNALNKGGYVLASTVKKLADALNCDVMELAIIEDVDETKGA